MKKKLKIKKKALVLGSIFLISCSIILIGICIGLNQYKKYKYKQTFEYKLTEHGYSLEEAKKIIAKYTTEEEINSILNIEKNNLIIELPQEKYFLNKNLNRYLAYAEKNKETSLQDIIAIVNVNRDYNFYENNLTSHVENKNLINVNKYYLLEENYIPEELTDINLQYSHTGNKITKEANEAYVSMWKKAHEAGYTLIVNSSYRNYEEQEIIYNREKNTKGIKEADKIAARPGYSEHQTGLAIDVFEIGNQSTTTFKESEAYYWLKENAHKFGFIERYPENKEYLTGYSFEAWHWRYVGEEVATKIKEENITFDEYYAFYIET